jgi:hypothetical protein
MKRLIIILILLISCITIGQTQNGNGQSLGGGTGLSPAHTGGSTVVRDTIIEYSHPETERQLTYITGLTVFEKRTLDTLNRHMLDSLNASSYLNAGFYCYWIKFPSNDTIFNIAQNNYNLPPVSGITLRSTSWKPNGTSGYYNTHFNPTTEGIGLAAYSLGVWTDTSDANDNVRDIGCADANYYAFLWHRPVTGDYQIVINSGSLVAITNAKPTKEMLMASRNGVWAVDVMRNDSLMITGNNQGTGIPDADTYLCALNSNGTPALFSAREQRCAFIGKGFTATQMRMIYNNTKTYWVEKW